MIGHSSIEVGIPEYDLCLGGCEEHYLLGRKVQLSPCAFYRECYLHPSGVDCNADYIFSGVNDGFKIVDECDIAS